MIRMPVIHRRHHILEGEHRDCLGPGDRPRHTQPEPALAAQCTQFDQKSTLCICQIISLKNLIVLQRVSSADQEEDRNGQVMGEWRKGHLSLSLISYENINSISLTSFCSMADARFPISVSNWACGTDWAHSAERKEIRFRRQTGNGEITKL